MIEKLIFKENPVSYSRFMQEQHSDNQSITDQAEMVDIDFFKRSISLHYQHSYAKKKLSNWIYRFIFFLFGIFFLILGTIIFCKTVNFECGLYFKNCFFVKTMINSLCLILAAGAFGIGYFIHPEKEAIEYLIGKVERELHTTSKHVQIEFHAIISNLVHEWDTSHQTIWIKKTMNG